MKVLHVIPSVAPRYGGPSYAVVGFCRALNLRGVRTVIATTNADGEGVLSVPTGVASTFEGIDTRFFARHGEGFKYSPALSRWLRTAVAEFDLVHIHAVFSHSSLAASRACLAAGVPYVVRPLGSLDPWSLTRNAWKKRLMLWSAVGTLLRGAAGMHFTTEDERHLAEPVTRDVPSVVIPLGVDDVFLAAPVVPAADRQHRIVALTRLHPKKNLAALIRAFHDATMGPEFALWRLAIAGAGDEAYRQALMAEAASGPAAARIDFHDWLEGERKIDWLRHSAVFALPSHQENFGLGLLEALACGVPAVVSRGVNLAPAVEAAEAGWVCGDAPVDLVRTLRQAMHDDSDRARRSAHAHALATRFSWAASAQALQNWYSAFTSLRGATRQVVAVGGRN